MDRLPIYEVEHKNGWIVGPPELADVYDAGMQQILTESKEDDLVNLMMNLHNIREAGIVDIIGDENVAKLTFEFKKTWIKDELYTSPNNPKNTTRIINLQSIIKSLSSKQRKEHKISIYLFEQIIVYIGSHQGTKALEQIVELLLTFANSDVSKIVIPKYIDKHNEHVERAILFSKQALKYIDKYGENGPFIAIP